METVLSLPKDLKDVEQSDFEILPDSVYRFKITAGEVKSSANGKYLEWETTCLDPAYKKAKVIERNSSNENALWRLKKFLSAIGDKDAVGTSIDAKKYIGREFMGEVITEAYEYVKDGATKKGKSNKFSDYYPIPGGQTTTSDTTQAPATKAAKAQVAEDVPF